MTDWSDWHAAYDDPASPLAERLDVVKRRLVDALDALAALDGVDGLDAADAADERDKRALHRTRRRVLSLCAGEGRDVVQVLAGRVASQSRMAVVDRVVLVERDAELATRAARSARAAGLTWVEIRCADAGSLASFADVLPVDVLLLCGVFGNLAHHSVRALVSAVPHLVTAGGFVLWTRGGSEPDRRPEVRRWFSEAGMEEVSFDGAPAPYGVGLHRRPAGALGGALPDPLFRFEEARGRPRRRG